MRLRVFGVGVDVARVARVQAAYARFGERFLRRAFHADEIAQFYARDAAQRPLFLASRWAVKEAAFKAFQRYRVLFPEICTARQRDDHNTSELVRHLQCQIQTSLPVADEVQALTLQFHGETAKLAAQLQLEEPHVSLSHDGDYAMAFVILQQREQIESKPHEHNR